MLNVRRESRGVCIDQILLRTKMKRATLNTTVATIMMTKNTTIIIAMMIASE